MIDRIRITAAFLLAGCALVTYAQPAKQDHPLISRYPGSEIQTHDVKEFDETSIPMGAFRKGKFTQTEKPEGKVTRIHYKNPQGRSTLEIARNYEDALKKAGFQIVFSCAGAECADPGTNDDMPAVGRWCHQGLDCGEPMRYFVAKLARDKGDIVAAVKVLNNTYSTGGTVLNIVEAKPMQMGLVTTSAEALNRDIRAVGHAPVYGIYFDTGKADIKPTSDATLTEIASLLKANPSMNLYVVGHTDNVGSHASNMELSKRRAAAVVGALTSKYKIAAARVQSAGVGSLSPVSTNRTEEGRAKNRRVELVEQ